MNDEQNIITADNLFLSLENDGSQKAQRTQH